MECLEAGPGRDWIREAKNMDRARDLPWDRLSHRRIIEELGLKSA
jgi:hypothetical protein